MRRVLSSSRATTLCVALLTLGLITSTFAATPARPLHPLHATSSAPSRITQAIDEHSRATLGRHPVPVTSAFVDHGSLPDGYDIEHIILMLQRSPEQEQELAAFIETLNDKNSPNFHKWLTPQQYGEYGVSQEDIGTVTGWLESHGLRVNKVYANNMMIDISANAGQLREAFQVDIHNIEIKGESHIANINNPSVPAAISPVVRGFFSLNDFKPAAHYKVKTDYTFAGCTSATSLPTEPGTCYAVTPQDNAVIYNLNPLWSGGISGQGQTIAVVEDTDIYNATGPSSDFNTYRNAFGLNTAFPSGNLVQAYPGCTDPGTNGDDGEAAIDSEMATAFAPSATIENIACASGGFTFGGILALSNMVNAAGPYPGVVSMSYGLCEAGTGNGATSYFYNTFQQTAAQGISAFVSSGDDGPSSCSGLFGEDYDVTSLGVTGWGESPYNVSVGGTDFEDVYNAKTGMNGGAPLSTYWSASNTASNGSALSYIPEMPWDDSCANTLIADVATGSFVTYGSTGFCNKVRSTPAPPIESRRGQWRREQLRDRKRGRRYDQRGSF